MERQDSLLAALERSRSRGLTKSELDKIKDAGPQLKELKASGAVRGPFRIGRGSRFFAAAHAPTREQVEARVEAHLRDAGLKVTSFSVLERVANFAPKSFFGDALSALKAAGTIVELRDARRSKLYVHSEPLREQLRPVGGPELVHPSKDPVPALSLAKLRPIYEAIKARQGGISAVTIFDLWSGVGGSQEELHRLLLAEAKKGHVTLHATSTESLSDAVVGAGIKLDGEPYPLVSVVLKGGA